MGGQKQMEAVPCINKLLNCTQDSLFKLTPKREVKRTNLNAPLSECDYWYLFMQQYLAVELLEEWFRQNQPHLLLTDEPAVFMLANQDALMFTKDLAPAFEIGPVTFDFTFTRLLFRL